TTGFERIDTHCRTFSCHGGRTTPDPLLQLFWQPAPLAQGTEHRPPEPGAEVRVLQGAPSNFRRVFRFRRTLPKACSATAVRPMGARALHPSGPPPSFPGRDGALRCVREGPHGSVSGPSTNSSVRSPSLTRSGRPCPFRYVD